MVELILTRGERSLYSLPQELRDISACHISARYEKDWRLSLDMTLEEQADHYDISASLRGPRASGAILGPLCMVSQAVDTAFWLPRQLVPTGLLEPGASTPYKPWQVTRDAEGWSAILSVPKADVLEPCYRWGPTPFYRYFERLLHSMPVQGVVRAALERP